MSEREKLIDLLDTVLFDNICDFCGESGDVGKRNVIEKTADYLLANGVQTVSHGHWVNLEPEIGLFSCSLCEHKILRSECNYCPNCGSEMGGDSNA